MKIKLDSETVTLGLDIYYAEDSEKRGYHCPHHTIADDILSDYIISEELFPRSKVPHCGLCD